MLDVQTECARELLVRVTQENAALKGKRLRILDVGGGHGQNIDLIRALGHEVIVLGSDQSCAQLIQDHIDNQNVFFQEGSLVSFPFDSDSFDIVISFRMLTHVKDWTQMISECCRVATASVIVDFPSRQSLNIFSKPLFWLKLFVEKNTRPYHVFRDTEIKQEFQKYNFKPDQQKKQYLLPMGLHRALNFFVFSTICEKIFRITKMTRLFGSPVMAAFKPE